MPELEDVMAQQQLLELYRRTLLHYLEQQAIHSTAYSPPVVSHGILEARENIRYIKSTLREWGVDVEDHPQDELRLNPSGHEEATHRTLIEHHQIPATPRHSSASLTNSTAHERSLGGDTSSLSITARMKQDIQELEKIIQDAEIEANLPSVSTRMRIWKERVIKVIKEAIDGAEALRFSSISAPDFVKGRQPRLISEARSCHTYLLVLLQKLEHSKIKKS